jgi:hypothetical protein
LSDRYREIDQADDIALTPEELFLTAEELRELFRCDSASSCARSARALRNRSEPRARRRSAQVQLGRARGTRQPCFFSGSRERVEVEWQSQSTLRYHGRIRDLAAK